MAAQWSGRHLLAEILDQAQRHKWTGAIPGARLAIRGAGHHQLEIGLHW